jgi:hypothetical protein
MLAIVPDPTCSVPEIVLPSAVVEENVDVDTPLPFVFGGAGLKAGFEPVDDKTTLAFWITLSNKSRAVTVISEPVPPPVVHDVWHAVMVASPRVRVECVPFTPAGITVTVGPATSTPPTVAEIVLASALVELNVEVDTPLELVFGGAVKLLPVPVEDMTTLAFWIRFENWSFAVMVTSDARPAAVVHVPEQAESVVCGVVTVDCDAETGPGVTVTGALSVIATPPAVAVTVFDSAMVEFSVQLATPLPLAVWLRLTGDVVFPPVPEIAIVTLTPPTPFPNWSFAVTVMTVCVPPPGEHDVWQAVIEGGAAPTVDCEAETPVVPTVTVADGVMLMLLAVALTVLLSDKVELSCQVAIPLLPAVWFVLTGVREFPSPLTLIVTLALGTALPNASFAAMVICDAVPAPGEHEAAHAVILDGLGVMVDCVAETAAAVTTMGAPAESALPPTVAFMVCDSAFVELNADTNCPLEFVEPLAGLNVWPVPV